MKLHVFFFFISVTKEVLVQQIHCVAAEEIATQSFRNVWRKRERENRWKQSFFFLFPEALKPHHMMNPECTFSSCHQLSKTIVWPNGAESNNSHKAPPHHPSPTSHSDGRTLMGSD